MSVLNLARPELLKMAPYSSARMESAALPLMLNANESAWPPPGDSGRGLHRYPEPQPLALRARMAKLYGVDDEQVLLTRGSDEAMDLLVRAFCRPGHDAILINPPTFGMYAVCAAVQGATVVEVPLDDAFQLDEQAMLGAICANTKLVFLCSPNNPTGGAVPLQVIEHLAGALAGRALLVVDEAYIEFADQRSAATLLARHVNLCVLRTLSKAWALAGVRIGALLADTDVIALLRRIMPPYPLPTPSVAAAVKTLEPAGEATMRQRVAATVSERERLRVALRELACVRDVLSSQANFLAVRFHQAAEVQRALVAAGIAVRDIGRYPRLCDFLRISIGTAEQNDAVVGALASTTVVA